MNLEEQRNDDNTNTFQDYASKLFNLLPVPEKSCTNFQLLS